MSEKFISLANATDLRINTNKLNLPFNLEQIVGIDTKGLKRFCQLAGVTHITIASDPDGETSEYEIDIQGMNAKGEAVAGKSAVKNVAVSNSLNKPDGNSARVNPRNIWSNLTVTINTNEIKSNILKEDKSVKNALIWADEINQAIAKGVVLAGLENLLTNREPVDLVMFAALFGLVVPMGLAIANSFNPENGIAVAAQYYLYSMLLSNNLVQFKNEYRENFQNGYGNRISAFPLYEIDRFLAVIFLANTKTLVKPLDK